jgi:UDP-N-acetylglucosamine 2-epimerase (hydrolysing)
MRLVFVSGTRADFGKIKPVILEALSRNHEVHVIATGMHLIESMGYTFKEIEKIENISLHKIEGQDLKDSLVTGFYKFTRNLLDFLKTNISNIDFVFVHGDRFDALAGAIVCNELSIKVAHIEGGEVSGTIDEAIRHSVSKFSHIHFVSNRAAEQRVLRLGENPKNVILSGSPETDVLLSEDLPTLEQSKERYNIDFENYVIFCFHPVTTELSNLKAQLKTIKEFLNVIKENIIWILPNNDNGRELIIDSFQSWDNANIKQFQSIRFEHYLTLLKHSKAIIGNSSSGIREAPVFGVPTLNLGTRQHGRSLSSTVINVDCVKADLLVAWSNLLEPEIMDNEIHFGAGSVSKTILDNLERLSKKNVSIQKVYYDN